MSNMDKKHIINFYYKFGSFVSVRSFLTSNGYHVKNLPSKSTIRYAVKMFERAGVLNTLGRVKIRTLKKRQ